MYVCMYIDLICTKYVNIFRVATGSPHIVFISTSGMLRLSDIIYIYIYIVCVCVFLHITATMNLYSNFILHKKDGRLRMPTIRNWARIHTLKLCLT